MTVPVYKPDTKIPRWQTARVKKEPVEDLEVFSLRVDVRPAYVADGIIVHNCLYNWAGASTDRLLDWPHAREVLSQSYRLPRKIWQVAHDVSAQISRRWQKDFLPTDREGHVEWLGRPDEVDLSAGTWLLLARTRRQLAGLADIARSQGVVHSVMGHNVVNQDHVRQILDYEHLRDRDPTVPLWHDALTDIDLDTREFLLSCLRRGESLTKPPRVRIETIHGAKGLEADNVLLLTDLNARVRRGQEQDPDAELRVLYVAVTRARECLFLVTPQSSGRGYEL
jgi:superfamily I DNA/RNA helicase